MKLPQFMLPMWEKFRASMGELNEFKQPLTAAQVEDVFDRQIRELNEQLDTAKASHATTKANRIAAQQNADRAKASQREVEEVAVGMLRSRKKAGAKILAEDVARYSESRCEWAEEAQNLDELEKAQAAIIVAIESRLKRTKYQLGAYKASLNLQRTQEALVRTGVPAPAPAPVRKRAGAAMETPEQVLERLEREAKKPATKRPSKTRKSS